MFDHRFNRGPMANSYRSPFGPNPTNKKVLLHKRSPFETTYEVTILENKKSLTTTSTGVLWPNYTGDDFVLTQQTKKFYFISHPM